MGVEPVLSRGHNRERRKGSPDLFVLTESLMVGIACTIGVIVLSIQGSCLQLGRLVSCVTHLLFPVRSITMLVVNKSVIRSRLAWLYL